MNRIAIAVPVRDDVKARFAFDLVSAVATHQATTDDVIIPLLAEGTLLQSQRTQLVLEARQAEATHVLFIDSDMRFPADTIGRLLVHGDKIVGANCAKRKVPTGPTANNYDAATKRHVPVYTLPTSKGLERIDFLGTGVLCVPMSVFDRIAPPWFATPWDAAHMVFHGEDTFFCLKLREVGIPLYIDHDLSKEIGHIGSFEYRHEHTYPEEKPLIEVAR